jgi:tetratricopeptide (TPR) repeat protein
LLSAHSLHVSSWEALIVDSSDWHAIGYAATELGRFAEARPWFERAVAAKEKGDVYGRVDASSLGTSLHQVGYCLSSQGQFAEARPWFERAARCLPTKSKLDA